MASLIIRTSQSGTVFGQGGGDGTSVKVTLDEAVLNKREFDNAAMALTASATAILDNLRGVPATLEAVAEVVSVPTVVVVPDDQMEAVGNLNRDHKNPAGLLLVPESAARMSWADAPLPDEAEAPEEADDDTL